jgi:hypothetical protein
MKILLPAITLILFAINLKSDPKPQPDGSTYPKPAYEIEPHIIYQADDDYLYCTIIEVTDSKILYFDSDSTQVIDFTDETVIGYNPIYYFNNPYDSESKKPIKSYVRKSNLKLIKDRRLTE